MIEDIKITSLSGRGSVDMKTRDWKGFWLGKVDLGQVEGSHNTYNYYNQVGADIVSTTVGTRPLSITGWVMDVDGGLRERCDFLNAFISPVEDYTLEVMGKKINFRPSKSVIYSAEYKQNNEKVRRFMIQAVCPYPLFRDANETVVKFDVSGKRFRFPTDWGRSKRLIFAATERAYSAQVSIVGGFATGIRAVLKFSGEVKNPRIKNLTTEQFIGVNRVFQKGEGLELCTEPGKKSMTLYTEGGEAQNIIKYRDIDTDWIQLTPGLNRLALDCDDLEQRANMTVTVYYTPLYLEVQ